MGKAAGRKIYLLLKSDNSHVQTLEKDGAGILGIKDDRLAEEWQNSPWPVWLVMRNVNEHSESSILWMDLSAHLEREPEREESAYDTRLMSWGDGSGVPTSGRNLVIVGTDNDGLLHIRIFNASGTQVTDTHDKELPTTHASAISAFLPVDDRLGRSLCPGTSADFAPCSPAADWLEFSGAGQPATGGKNGMPTP